jgi:hypothetical protein
MIKKDDPKTSYNSVYMPLLRNGTYTRNVTVHCKKDKTDDRMTKVFLLHKDKEKGNPPHIQAHLSLPDTKANASQSQKSLHFANPQTDR